MSEKDQIISNVHRHPPPPGNHYCRCEEVNTKHPRNSKVRLSEHRTKWPVYDNFLAQRKRERYTEATHVVELSVSAAGLEVGCVSRALGLPGLRAAGVVNSIK